LPNGGSDCCGTCWFNSTNEGQPGYREKPSYEGARCTIRNVATRKPFWTYCVNHPHHNPVQLALPIGPIDVAAEDTYSRELWVESPDLVLRAGFTVPNEWLE
jgi:hypothetical protein